MLRCVQAAVVPEEEFKELFPPCALNFNPALVGRWLLCRHIWMSAQGCHAVCPACAFGLPQTAVAVFVV
jgi:hypothetical protein